MESQFHISVFEKSKPPQVTRCTTCCVLFHCPLCPTGAYKPRCKAKVLQHLEVHMRNALQHEDFYITKCNHACRTGKSGHFHCPFCSRTTVRRQDAERHLEICRPLSVLVEERPQEKTEQTDPIPEGAAAVDCRKLPESSLPSVDNPSCRMHVTYLKKGQDHLLSAEQCTTCCSGYHCIYCNKIFGYSRQILNHLEQHVRFAVPYEDFVIVKCGLGCRQSSHFHCCYCGSSIMRRNDLMKHLNVCKDKACRQPPPFLDPETSPATAPPPSPETAPPPSPATEPQWCVRQQVSVTCSHCGIITNKCIKVSVVLE